MTDKNTIINGVKVETIHDMYDALSYLSDSYNEGDRYMAEGGDVLCIKSRRGSMPAHVTGTAQKCDKMRIAHIGVSDGKAYVELREN